MCKWLCIVYCNNCLSRIALTVVSRVRGEGLSSIGTHSQEEAEAVAGQRHHSQQDDSHSAQEQHQR